MYRKNIDPTSLNKPIKLTISDMKKKKITQNLFLMPTTSQILEKRLLNK